MRLIIAPLILLAFLPSLSGCIAYSLTGEYKSVDSAKVAQIKPGETSLSDVFSFLGPPDYIIDGTRRIIDNSGGPPRTLTSPEGTVILVYGSTSAQTTFIGGGVVPAAQARSTFLSVDLFVFVSKKDRRVLEIARSVSVQ